MGRFPYPISVALADFEAAEDPASQFRTAMRAFTTVLKYCSSAAICDYLAWVEELIRPSSIRECVH